MISRVLVPIALFLTGCASAVPTSGKAGETAPSANSLAKPSCDAEAFDIYFEDGETEPTPEATVVIQTVGQRYAECELSLISIEGHADSDGPSDVNMAVSRQRAEAVSALLLNMDVDADRILIIPFGETRAITPEGEEKPLHRKTVVRIVP